MARVLISNTTKTAAPTVPLLSIAQKLLSKEYELSITFIGDKKSRTLNRTFRQKDKPTNVLSFALSENAGDIYLTLPRIEKEHGLFSQTAPQYTAYLLIHGILHLKGLAHGGTMDKLERKWCSHFQIPYPYTSAPRS